MQKPLAEALGSFLLLVAILGSGIMANRLAGGNDALALLANAIATGCALYVIITLFAPISGAHFNPAVTLVMLIRAEISTATAMRFIAAQLIGALLGVMATHVMFDLPVLQIATTPRASAPGLFSEVLATVGLLLVILVGRKSAPNQVAALVACYITGAYWFTSSTSFANPVVTIGRALSDTFAGIAPASVLPFIAAQLIGLGLAIVIAKPLLAEN